MNHKKNSSWAVFEEIYLDQRVKISEGVRFLYLLSSRSDPPIGDDRGNKGRLLLAIENMHLSYLMFFVSIWKQKYNLP